MENIWFTSDTHFSHENIIKFCNRPFDSIKEHNEALIENWNSVVKPGDRIYHLGDFGFDNQEKLNNILRRLMGQKFFIRGNHDRAMKGNLLGHFVWHGDYKEIKIPDIDAKDGKQQINLFHYPIASWNKIHYLTWNLHGHCHGNFPSNNLHPIIKKFLLNQKRIDVSVDNWDYFPVHYDVIKQHMKNKIFEHVDQHDEKRR